MTKRYRPDIHTEYSWYGEFADHFPCMKQDKDGAYVTFESHNVTAKQLHNVIEKNKKLKAEIESLKNELNKLKNS